MRIVEPVLMASLTLAAPAGFVGMAYMGPNFISADFNGFEMSGNRPPPPATSQPAKEGAGSGSGANTATITKPKAKKPLPPDGPGLRGATMPHCSPGYYTAGYECKIGPPNHYVPVGAIYPILCPPGTVSKVGSQSKGQCTKVEVEVSLVEQGKGLVKSTLAVVKKPL